MSVNVFADDHSDNSELVEKAKKITEEIANKNQIDEDEVPLNDPFAGNEGMSSSTVNPETGLFEEPTIPDMYPAIDEKMKAIIIMSNVINNDVGTSASIWL